jgi:catechol 2,3-dioxygenase-like lactoylglutathione lyase family enzyme
MPMKIKLDRVRESLSVPSFYMAYRELGQKYGLFCKNLEKLIDFFSALSSKNLRRIFIAFGLHVIVDEDYQVAFYVGGDPGLLVVKTEVPPEARQPGKYTYECPHCGRVVDGEFLDDSGVAALAGLYVDPARVQKIVVEFLMVQPLEVSFPYSGKKQWHEEDVLRIVAEHAITVKLGLPEMLPPEESRQVIELLTDQLGFDVEKWAETRARNIKQGIEPEPDFYGYKRVD